MDVLDLKSLQEEELEATEELMHDDEYGSETIGLGMMKPEDEYMEEDDVGTQDVLKDFLEPFALKIEVDVYAYDM